MLFLWSLSEKSPLMSPRTFLSILAVLNSDVMWMVSTRPPTSKSSGHLNNPLFTVPKGPITIGLIITSMFHVFFFFQSPCKVDVLILLFTFFQFHSVVSRESKVDNFANFFFFFFFLLIIIRSGLLAEIW